MKRIHILQHEKYETPGCIDHWIKSKSYNCTVAELYERAVLPDVSAFDWLIVMGGSMSVHDTDKFPWLADEKKFIKNAVDAGKVAIGICLGSQLIAEVLGSKVYQNHQKEIGWFPVSRNIAAGDSFMLKRFSDMETVFHWHGDTFDIPEGAKHCFTSDACRNQCFIYNERILGLQFHLEVTEDLLEGMLAGGAGEIVPSQYIQSADEIKDGSVHIKRNNELMFSILDELDKLSV